MYAASRPTTTLGMHLVITTGNLLLMPLVTFFTLDQRTLVWALHLKIGVPCLISTCLQTNGPKQTLNTIIQLETVL